MSMKRRIALLATCAAVCAAVVGGSVGQAAARRGTIALHETAVMKLIKNEVNFHEAAGSATGTFKGRVRLRINVENASKMTARFASKGAKGGLIGSGVASYSVSGSILKFSGTAKITGGTGSYENAHGTGIHFDGVMNRLKETMTITFDGTMTT